MTTVAVVGTGWRAAYFWRAAAVVGMPCVGVVSRSARDVGLPVFATLEDCLARARPDLVVVAVPPAQTPDVLRPCVSAGVPVLAETPPAPDVDGLRALWADVGGSGLVQVAEQYPLLPSHAARLALVASGAIGTPTQVQVSSTHGYHAVALVRAYLGAGCGPVTVRASTTTAPLVDPLDRDGWTGDDTPRAATTTIATLDLGSDGSGLYDFTEGQWHNQLRFRRILVRGSRGELRDDVVRLVRRETVVRSRIERRQTGYDLDLDGFDTDHLTHGSDMLYRNPFGGHRLADEEIAIATLLQRAAEWVRGVGPAPYPLAQGCQDQLVALAVERAAATGETVTTAVEPWAG